VLNQESTTTLHFEHQACTGMALVKDGHVSLNCMWQDELLHQTVNGAKKALPVIGFCESWLV